MLTPAFKPLALASSLKVVPAPPPEVTVIVPEVTVKAVSA